MVNSDHRQDIDRYIAAREWKRAADRLRTLWKEQPTPANASFTVACFEQLRPHVLLTPLRVALLRSFTLEPAVVSMRAAAYNAGIDATVRIGQFNSYAQEILDPASDIYQFGADTVILAVQTCDIAPELWYGYADLSSQRISEVEQRVVREFQSYFAAFRAATTASMIVHTLESPARPAHGTLDNQFATSQADSIQGINREIKQAAQSHTGIYCLDYEGLISRVGKERWHDERKWQFTRMPFAVQSLSAMADEWVRYLYAMIGKRAKVLVTDLDNTLWGGVVGEDGADGVKIGTDYPGTIYLAVQRVILDLSRRGVILAACSKNNPQDALQVLDSRPEMLLRSSHFSALRINWVDKATNIREIAEELNVGLDSIAFLDDSEIEREQVRSALPEVDVIDVPKDPAGFPEALRNYLGFERLQISAEDTQRAQFYTEQRQRSELLNSVTSTTDFYRALQQEVEVVPITGGMIARVAQLTQKTNQFNLTTRRYTEQEIGALLARPDARVYSVRVKDRFGDNGITGVIILRFTDDVAEIDTFLLSCRIIGRTVETAVVAYLLKECRHIGANRLEGWFIPSKKNTPAEPFYESHGFQPLAQEGGKTRWSLGVAAAEVSCPDWIRLNSSQEQASSAHACT